MTADAEPPIDIACSIDDAGVAMVELRRPPDNFFDVELIARLADTFDELAAGGRCRAVVLASQGKNFCAGARLVPGGHKGSGASRLYDEALRLFRQPLPVVAAVQGAAIGGGLGLALAADFRIASPQSRFSANFARLGFHHGFGLSVTLPRLAGQQTAALLLLTGRRVDGETARRLGLCDDLVPAEELRPAAVDLAREIAGAAPLAVASIRATLRTGLADEVEAAVRREQAEQARLIGTDDWREGVAAARERRTPRFTGR